LPVAGDLQIAVLRERFSTAWLVANKRLFASVRSHVSRQIATLNKYSSAAGFNTGKRFLDRVRLCLTHQIAPPGISSSKVWFNTNRRLLARMRSHMSGQMTLVLSTAWFDTSIWLLDRIRSHMLRQIATLCKRFSTAWFDTEKRGFRQYAFACESPNRYSVQTLFRIRVQYRQMVSHKYAFACASLN
jgi:hypothetical protein